MKDLRGGNIIKVLSDKFLSPFRMCKVQNYVNPVNTISPSNETERQRTLIGMTYLITNMSGIRILKTIYVLMKKSGATKEDKVAFLHPLRKIKA